ncbi:MAG: hypothetical protein EA422_08260 [Gemmatimonadales bacterium]|nr:MAG: hypothetical protein EA422_08260 [Gemmatimonadales bacterium]
MGAILLPAAPVLAQSGPTPQAQEMTREEMLAAIHAQFEREMVQELGLDRQTMGAIRDVMTSMVERRRDLYQRRRALRTLSREFHETGGDEATARRILSETRAIRSQEALLEAEEESQLLQIMSPAEVLRFQALRDDFNERIRRMHRGRIDGI